MSIVELILLLVVAGVLGVVSQRLTGIQPGGLIMTVILGFVGAWLGKQFSVWLNIYDPIRLRVGGTEFPLLCAIVGGVIVTSIVGWIQWRGRRRRANRKK